MGYRRTILSLLLILVGVFTNLTTVDAAATTVTLKNGNLEEYGTYSTRVRWVTHVNGEAIDLDDEPGVSRSYAYCVQPAMDTPDPGTYTVTVVDDDDSGKVAKMRKLIYYLPGAYGYTSVTKSRWFAKLPSGTSAYTIGHVALSYLYDNCSSNTDAWTGTNSAIKEKVKSIIADLDNLPDAPEEFEVFWIKTSGKQDTFGAIYATEYGKAAIHKVSALTGISEGNACYSLEGAKYALYEDEACQKTAKTKSNGDAVVTVKADGNSEPIEVETGSYYAKETVAPRGYALDKQVYSVKVSRNKTTTIEAKDIPKSNAIGVLLEKVDKETGLSVPQGAARLEGAEFLVKYYDVYPSSGMSEEELLKAVAEQSPGKIDGKDAVWKFKIDQDCVIDWNDVEQTLVKEESAGFYLNSKGEKVLPIGIVTIQEVTAPKGYLLNNKVFARAITEEGNVEGLNTLQTLTEENAVSNQVYRADIEFTKSSEGLDRMQNVPFRITSLTTKESHIVVTDENGYANTSEAWNKHDYRTNEGETNEDGVWFGGMNDEEKNARPDNTLAALPYDTYLLEELPCDSNKGHNLFSDTITIKRNGVLIDLGTIDDKLIPEQIEEKVPEKETPKTGDRNMLVLYSIMALLSLAEYGLLTAQKKGGRLLNR